MTRLAFRNLRNTLSVITALATAVLLVALEAAR
jgi:hypothetical protein